MSRYHVTAIYDHDCEAESDNEAILATAKCLGDLQVGGLQVIVTNLETNETHTWNEHNVSKEE